MRRSQILALAASAALIFTFVTVSSDVTALGSGLQETMREVGNSEKYQEAGGTMPTDELRREAGEWQSEFSEIANEDEFGFEGFLEEGREEALGNTDPPSEADLEAQDGLDTMERLREGSPLGGGGGDGDCSGGGYCPPSCMSCDPYAY